MKTNTKRMVRDFTSKTHEGAPARVDAPAKELRRAVLSCLLWENQFYESGEDIADRITKLATLLPPEEVAALAVEARNTHHLRHVPLLLLTVLARTGAKRPGLVANTVEQVIQRADEPGELLSLYWKAGKRPISAQLKKGLAKAITKFDAYRLAKYNRQVAVKLQDVIFLTHAKPKDDQQAENWKKLIAGTLESPDTWEVALSAGADKKETFTRLLEENKLGYLALLRNLRNMAQADVDLNKVKEHIIARKGADRVWPFRYVAAARACPQLEPALDEALLAAIKEMKPLEGNTLVLVDVSGSMRTGLSQRSDMTRQDAAAALASIIQGNLRVFAFANNIAEVPPRRGMAGVDAINEQARNLGGGTELGKAIQHMNGIAHDRLIVITDEQSHDRVPGPAAKKAYMINVGSYKPSVAYGPWTRIEGFSESIIRYIQASEAEDV